MGVTSESGIRKASFGMAFKRHLGGVKQENPATPTCFAVPEHESTLVLAMRSTIFLFAARPYNM